MVKNKKGMQINLSVILIVILFCFLSFVILFFKVSFSEENKNEVLNEVISNIVENKCFSDEFGQIDDGKFLEGSLKDCTGIEEDEIIESEIKVESNSLVFILIMVGVVILQVLLILIVLRAIMRR